MQAPQCSMDSISQGSSTSSFSSVSLSSRQDEPKKDYREVRPPDGRVEGACVLGASEPRPDGGHAVPLGEAQPPPPCPSWTHVLKCLCVCVGVGVYDGRGYSKKPPGRDTCRPTALRLFYKARSRPFPPAPSAHLLTWCVVPDFLQRLWR